MDFNYKVRFKNLSSNYDMLSSKLFINHLVNSCTFSFFILFKFSLINYNNCFYNESYWKCVQKEDH